MDLYQLFFNWDGRLNRIQYIRSILTIVVITALFTSIVFIIDGQTKSSWALIAFYTIYLSYAYTGMVLTAKRLHDIGYGAINLIWIVIINTTSSIFQYFNYSVCSLIFAGIGLGISLYLFVEPSKVGKNCYGDSPDQ